MFFLLLPWIWSWCLKCISEHSLSKYCSGLFLSQKTSQWSYSSDIWYIYKKFPLVSWCSICIHLNYYVSSQELLFYVLDVHFNHMNILLKPIAKLNSSNVFLIKTCFWMLFQNSSCCSYMSIVYPRIFFNTICYSRTFWNNQ